MNRQKLLFNILPILLIVGVTLYDIRNLDMITVLNDEFGYWSNAAIMAGINWKPLMAETPYYSFGYSILLVPLFFMFKDYAILYKSAIVLNVLLLAASYFCAKYIVSNLLNVKSEMMRFSLSIISVLTGTVIFQSQIGWSETLITFLMWASIALLISIEKKISIWKVLGLSVLCVYMMSVHQRMIVCVVICLGCLCGVLIQEKWSKKQIAVFILTLGAGYLIYKVLKTVQISQFYGNSSSSAKNNISVNGNFFLNYFNKIVSDFKLFFISFGGKITTCLFVTYFTFPIVVYQYAYDTLQHLKKKIKMKYFWTYTYIVFSFVCMVLATSLQMMNCFSRKDMVVYTRYFDYTVGPVILLGMYALLSKEKKSIRLFVGTYLVYGILLYKTFDIVDKAQSYFNVPCSPVYGAIMQYSKKLTEDIDWGYCKGLALGGGLVIFLCIFLSYFIRKEKIKYLCVTVILLVGQIYIGRYSNEWLNNARDEFRKNAQSISELTGEDEHSIYYVKNPEKTVQYSYFANPKYLQFMLGNKTINVITWDKESIIEENSWVLVEKSEKIENTSYQLIKTTDKLYLYQKEGK